MKEIYKKNEKYVFIAFGKYCLENMNIQYFSQIK